MEKHQFMNFLTLALYENPEWMPDTIKVASQGVLERLKDNLKTSTEIQFSLSLLYSNQYGKLSKENKVKVLKSILQCEVFQGSPFEQQIKEKLESIEKG